MLEWHFLIFRIFILFFWIFLIGLGWNELGTKFVFLLILGHSHSVLPRDKARMMFFIFWIFILFFWNFLNRVRLERTRNNFFFLTLGLSRTFLAWNKVRMMFFNVLNFYTIFLKFSKPGWVGMDSERNFVFLFSVFPVPFWLQIKSEWCF